MDKSVPKGAALLLAFVYETETGKAPPECYEVIFGNRQTKLAKPITHMTLSDLQRSQKYWASSKWAARFGSKAFSSAAGAPQLMRKTLADLMKEIGLSGAEVFTSDMQDRLGFRLLRRRGYEDWAAEKISDTEFAKRLAMEWASFPVLVDCQGAHRKIPRGCSYYAGDGLNKALVHPEAIEALLAKVKAVASEVPTSSPSPQEPLTEAQEPVPAPSQPQTPERASATKQGGIAVAFVLLIGALAAWFASLPCDWFGILCK